MTSRKAKLTHSGAKLIVTAFTIGCSAIVLSVPTPIAPHRPTLSTSTHTYPFERVDSDNAKRVRELYLTQGHAEAGGGESNDTFDARRDEMKKAVSTLSKEDIGNLRNQAIHELLPTLARLQSSGESTTADDNGILGSFPKMLARYGLAQNGQLRASDFVVQSLFKARWNSIHHLPLTDGFSDAEHYAYSGWLAIESAQPIQVRQEALAKLEQLKSTPQMKADLLETKAYMAFQQKSYAEAATWYNKAFEATASNRLRNHALFAQRLAL